MPARTCFPLGSCSTRWSPGSCRSEARALAVVAEAILNRTPVAPVRLNPGRPPKLEEIINKALEKDRKLRYQSAADIRTDLQRLRARFRLRVVRLRRQRKSSRSQLAKSIRWWLIAGTITLLIGLAAGRLIFPHKAPTAHGQRHASSSPTSITRPATPSSTARCGRGYPYNWNSHPSSASSRTSKSSRPSA